MLSIPKLKHTDSNNFFLISGPCAIESREVAFEVAEAVLEISNKLKIPFIFKGSYRKANRSKLDSFTGIGDIEALEILKEIGDHFDIPTITDIHESKEAALAAKYVDVLQIPAFLCRQTDLLLAAGETGKAISIKKGQFLSGSSMKFAVEKIKSTGNNNIALTDRGNSFGYTDMVVDFRNIPDMKAHDVPVIMDITHSLQQPNQPGGVTGGKPELIETIGRAAIAVGADGIFIETHPRPHEALSDGANMLLLDNLEGLMERLVKLRQTVVQF